jgi:hypothetical protein
MPWANAADLTVMTVPSAEFLAGLSYSVLLELSLDIASGILAGAPDVQD